MERGSFSFITCSSSLSKPALTIPTFHFIELEVAFLNLHIREATSNCRWYLAARGLPLKPSPG
ncbi:hypothetical protein T4A_4832 [Trichinella pseudospiralis]|uniref:Uncharacterized protein n=1 Tax=Trichinella pseudospiralis TaxID=6337 RepID=A0A0V1EWK0_TRIPS|nr:hypothetical protein T4A_4832 [Trichinella pseudospiralis]KRZ40228.1 hypothetical protein T4C_318 [Trichinella pseudospiralis]